MRDKPCLTSVRPAKGDGRLQAEAEKNKWNVSIAIVDDGGYLLVVRPHGRRRARSPPRSRSARRTRSAMTRRPSKFFEDRVKERPAFVNFPAGMLIQGAVPIMARANASARSASPASHSHEDEQVAQAGVSAVA